MTTAVLERNSTSPGTMTIAEQIEFCWHEVSLEKATADGQREHHDYLVWQQAVSPTTPAARTSEVPKKVVSTMKPKFGRPVKRLLTQLESQQLRDGVLPRGVQNWRAVQLSRRQRSRLRRIRIRRLAAKLMRTGAVLAFD